MFLAAVSYFFAVSKIADVATNKMLMYAEENFIIGKSHKQALPLVQTLENLKLILDIYLYVYIYVFSIKTMVVKLQSQWHSAF